MSGPTPDVDNATWWRALWRAYYNLIYKTRSRRTKTALFVGKTRYRKSQPTEFLATPWGAHNSHAEDDERNAKASLSNADSIDLHRLTCRRQIRSS